MSNFAFLKAVNWPEIHADCARAESYATSDPTLGLLLQPPCSRAPRRLPV